MSLFQKKEPITVEVKGKQLVCLICSNNYFWTRSPQLKTSAASFFGLDWANLIAFVLWTGKSKYCLKRLIF